MTPDEVVAERERLRLYHSEYDKRWYPKNKVRLAKLRKKYYLLNRDKLNAYRREHYRKNREHNLEVKRQYFQNNKKLIYKKYKKWAKTLNGRMFLKKKSAQETIKKRGLTVETIKQVYEENIKRFGVLSCYLCYKPIPTGKDHIEHKTPFVRGGTNAKENLGVSCQFCNCSKHNKTEAEFRLRREKCQKN